ncbi:nucleotidyltransferase domain-containing protein [Lysinibacillus sp. Bpr_S20]|uniref:nucleotidyltransferase domain-containing protein n=1 Tax=Lysinibacillus sp. Bpr_S20 TaxID=2933964 RepID=UPI0020130F75|nr:nucleotidyltransferase domain-containing protein [Lysinibacillus sp. Bpr_S20]MCL1702296.1 nucleotidyltransferase domain-containing protein [Lysinibacillus sp. Bpr_S20]
MKEWERALEEFLKDWKNRNDVIGALVCGSYVTGDPSTRSDIDVHIILSEDVDWRERGNRIVNGFLIEYFANPPKQIRQYFQEDFQIQRIMSMVQFMTGKILFDNTGILNELKIEAEHWLNNEYDELNKTILEIKKYTLWDSLDNLKDCFEQQRVDFPFVYFNSLAKLFSEYCQFLRLESIPYHQVHAYLIDPAYMKKYLKDVFPDLIFKEMFLKALLEADKQRMMDAYEELVNHVFNQMGGFKIDGWKLKSPVEEWDEM